MQKCETDSGYESPQLSRSGLTVAVNGCYRDPTGLGAWIIHRGKRTRFLGVDDGLLAFAGDDRLLIARNTRNGAFAIDRWPVRDPGRRSEQVARFGTPKVNEEVFGLDVPAAGDRAVVVAGRRLPYPNTTPPQTNVWVVSLTTGTSRTVPGITDAERAVWGRKGSLIVQHSTRWTTVDPATGKTTAFAPRPTDAMYGHCELAGAARRGLIAWCPATASLLRIEPGGKTTARTTLKTKRTSPAEVSVAVDALGW
ncbi:hypothetical protein [Actinomadura roseirufa]|uniref:hypothetical protein n=1 Tax=Actinomadura roseirufa TaxID=2094049 RepID=UPI0010412FA0|nr:hypothetical protein [Actinomadura roseirufa]